MERETQIRAPAKHDSPLVVLLARVESTIRHPRRSRRRGVDAFRKLSGRAISSTRVSFSSLSAFYASIGRARRVAALASNFSFHSAGFASFSLSSRARTHARTRTTDRREYVSSSASSFSSACEDKRTSSKTDRRPLALHDTPRVIKRGEETRELLCITRDAREP